MTKELGKNKEINEWQNRLDWLNPSEVEINGDDLHWSKINQDTAWESFRAMERMRPFLDKANLFEGKNRYACRDRLSEMKDESGKNMFNDQDLKFFDLYFGSDRIKVDRIGDHFDVTNGRHRLRAAQMAGVKELPVLLNEKISKENTMSNFELADIEKETLEQHEEAEQMETDIERHQERAEELQEALGKIRAASAEIGSDRLRETEQRVEDARLDTERKLDEIRHRRDEMLWENKELAGKIIVQNEKRREVHNQIGQIKMMFDGASDEFKSQISRAGDALSEELKNLAGLQESLLEARSKLERLDV